MLDNASDDGSADYVRAEHPEVKLIALDRRTGKAENDSTLLREATGRYALLLNEDAELQPNAAERLVAALDADPNAAVAAAQLLDPSGDAAAHRVAAARASARRWPRRRSCTGGS